jgi:two-component system sensor histidine kinase and response regulator WspE
VFYIKVSGNKRILIVEDDHDLRELYAEILRDEGYEVDESADGESGLEHIESEHYDLILLDIMLPKKDGLELLKQVRSTERQNTSKIVLLTNLDRESVIKEGFQEGADGYIIKSEVDPGALIQEVKAFLGEGE